MTGARPRLVLLITTDEQRRDTLGAYGCRAIATPHIDGIAARGARFDNAYTVSPWCLPSRCSILTGCYPRRHGAYSNFRAALVPPELPNLYTTCADAGYATSHVGKCHFEPVRYGTFEPDATAESPATRDYYLSLGIDHLALQDDKNVSVWQYDDYSRALDRAGHLAAYRREAWNRENGGVFTFPGPERWHPDRWVGGEAVRYLQDWDAARDLFMWVSFSGPHYPIDPPEAYLDRVALDRLPPMARRQGAWNRDDRIHYQSYTGGGGIDGATYAPGGACRNYDDAYWQRMRQHYLANMSLIDDQVGDVLAAAQRTFGDDQLVIFTTDHGDMLGNHGLWGKNNCGYDEVLKVPFLVSGAGWTGGHVVDERVQTIDILPTIAKAVAAPVPTVDGAPLDEVVARGGYDHALAEGENFFCLSDDRYKLIRARSRESGRIYHEFYDMTVDPDCFDNVFDRPDYQAPLAKLQTAMLEAFVDHVLP